MDKKIPFVFIIYELLIIDEILVGFLEGVGVSLFVFYF